MKVLGSGFVHWFSQRASAMFLVGTGLGAVSFDSLTLGFLLALLVFIHFEMGLHSIIGDYLHDAKSKVFLNATIDLLILFLAKTVFVIFLYF